jgi:FkbM family methyltransferase
MLKILRWLRHGPLAFLGPAWPAIGRRYRSAVRRIPGLTVKQKIGAYGPFRFISEFTFSKFEDWGSAHNKGFRYCVEACRGKTCVLDVGAHIGLVAMPIASVLGEGGRLYAFEPAAANARILRQHLALNGLHQVEVVETLVGEHDQKLVGFYESVGPHGQNSIVLKSKNALQSEWGDYIRTERAQVSLDAFCERLGLKPEVIKIDVEGAEINVLRGARALLRRSHPLIILSVHPREIVLAGGSLDALRKLLDELGYEIHDVNGLPVTELKLDEYVVVPRNMAQAHSTMKP